MKRPNISHPLPGISRRISLLLAAVISVAAFLLVAVAPRAAAGSEAGTGSTPPPPAGNPPVSSHQCFLPLTQTAAVPLRRVNAPFLSDPNWAHFAVFWYGQVTMDTNYTDVRVSYNANRLTIHVQVVDRLLWYDRDRRSVPQKASDLTSWDSVELLLSTNGHGGGVPDAGDYRFIGQISWYENRDRYRLLMNGAGGKWSKVSGAFNTSGTWRGNAPNDITEDRGWSLTFHIPWADLGMSGPPTQGTTWGLAAVTHDRDDASLSPFPDLFWPEVAAVNTPKTWGELVFTGANLEGNPVASSAGDPRTVTIRHNHQGAVVPDGAVGGNTNCGGAIHLFKDWGIKNYDGSTQVNIQNQSDIADFGCFSRYYLDFPLGKIPAGKVIQSATLRMHMFGQSWGGQAPTSSLIQVFTTGDPWTESTLTWNNGPLAMENISASWVHNMPGPLVWPGVPYDWDVTRAVQEAYQASQGRLGLALYDASTQYHDGKYFSSSDTGDWNAIARPTLFVVWADPTP